MVRKSSKNQRAAKRASNDLRYLGSEIERKGNEQRDLLKDFSMGQTRSSPSSKLFRTINKVSEAA